MTASSPLPAPESAPLASPDVAVARSADGDRVVASITAGSAAEAVAASAAIGAGPWAVALVFAASPTLLADTGEGLRAALDGIDVAGCTSAGIVNRRTWVEAPVQVTLLGGLGMTAAVSVGQLDVADSRAAGQAAAQAVRALDPRPPHSALVVLADGLTGDTNHIVRGAYEVAGALVPIVGGCAGDNLAMTATWQLAGDQLLTRSVVGVALGSTAPLGVGVRHGWSPIGSPMTVTAADGNSILTLDDRPALDAYLEALGVTEASVGPDLARFSQTRPLGLESRGGHQVRFIRATDPERRSMEFLVAIGEGELVTLMQGGSDTVVAAAGSAVDDALAQLTGDPLGVVAFDCVACRGVIGDGDLACETATVAGQLPAGATLSGLYTYGEIARRGGSLGFHNQTMVVLAVQ